jgi:hypothetical protein
MKPIAIYADRWAGATHHNHAILDDGVIRVIRVHARALALGIGRAGGAVLDATEQLVAAGGPSRELRPQDAHLARDRSEGSRNVFAERRLEAPHSDDDEANGPGAHDWRPPEQTGELDRPPR